MLFHLLTHLTIRPPTTSLSTVGAMYQRAEGSAIQVEECPCLGSCSLAPCVGIEHDDFLGYVSLEGMNDGEFGAKAYVVLYSIL